jgi:hypothetical protein
VDSVDSDWTLAIMRCLFAVPVWNIKQPTKEDAVIVVPARPAPLDVRLSSSSWEAASQSAP